jgi:Asp-tRNA(Asn)/Glu-tRNA(Gln) amidotransferase A subunit family amidase
MDHIGLITRSVRMCHKLYSAVRENNDSSFLSIPSCIRFGFIAEAYPVFGDAEIYMHVRSLLSKLQLQGHVAEMCNAPLHCNAVRLFQRMLCRGVRTQNEAFYNSRDEFYIEISKAINDPLKRTERMHYYFNDQNSDSNNVDEEVKELRDQYDALLTRFDVLALPTVVISPPPLTSVSDNSLPHLTKIGFNTCCFNLTHHPTITLPCGMTRWGLPVGISLVARHDMDSFLLNISCFLVTQRIISKTQKINQLNT